VSTPSGNCVGASDGDSGDTQMPGGTAGRSTVAVGNSGIFIGSAAYAADKPSQVPTLEVAPRSKLLLTYLGDDVMASEGRTTVLNVPRPTPNMSGSSGPTQSMLDTSICVVTIRCPGRGRCRVLRKIPSENGCCKNTENAI